MGFVGSDLWKVRQKWGGGRLLWPGVTVLVFNEDDKVWMGKRNDNGNWSTVGGYYELGDSAEGAARRELREELGAEALELKMIGVLTDPKITLCVYPNGDEVQSPSHIFFARVNAADVKGDDEHATFEWVAFDDVTQRARSGFGYTSFAVQAYKRWKETGEFQIG